MKLFVLRDIQVSYIRSKYFVRFLCLFKNRHKKFIFCIYLTTYSIFGHIKSGAVFFPCGHVMLTFITYKVELKVTKKQDLHLMR
jgi:hypothetical protein